MIFNLKFDLLLKNLATSFEAREMGLSYCTCALLVTRPFTGMIIFYIVTYTLKSDLLLKNFNIGHHFQTRRDGAFIHYMCSPCDKTFHIVPYTVESFIFVGLKFCGFQISDKLVGI